ncbi:hypothetical protein V9T40_012917 [Parthenolecanium corni]|uniref:Galactosylgalactosylxylosylprotein 3-beta-glucuronosyltransferase n=1 Tax=Parthenolecanium corni TaxID=536013 RepID=A0AAN9XZL4_9HEMI
MRLLTSLAFAYAVIQYHVSITWSLPRTESLIQGNVTEQSKKLWLKPLFDDPSVALQVQEVIGEEASQDLLARFNELAVTKSCTFTVNKPSPTPPTIYVITPTYRRPEQMAELTRLSQTLMHVEKLIWLLIEDAVTTSIMVSKFLKQTGISHVHLSAGHVNVTYKGGGVSSRNRGLQWIRQNAREGVVYFADDDNTYDILLFKEMRYTKKVSMWPVGLVTETGLSTPVVRDGKLVGFYDGWIGGRKFPVDMASFAINIQFLKSRPHATMAYKVGYEEDSFLKSLAPLESADIELRADNCSKVLVWHTQTIKNRPAQKIDHQKFNGTNLMKLERFLVYSRLNDNLSFPRKKKKKKKF